MKRDWKKIGCVGLLLVTEVYEVQFMIILNSVFGANRDNSNKTKEKAKRGKEQVKAAGKHSNCLFKFC